MTQAREDTARTFVDVFAGAGGLSLGLMKSGWTGLFAVERDSDAFSTLKHNLLGEGKGPRYSWPEWLPQESLDIGVFIRRYRKELTALQGQVDLLAGGPPCQGFSFAGRRNQADPRNRLFKKYAELVGLLEPKFLLLENVPGIAVAFNRRPGKPGRPPKAYSRRISDKLGKLGYSVHPMLLRAVEYGVPQLRPRYFLLGMRSQITAGTDQPDLGARMAAARATLLEALGLEGHVPVSSGDALSDLMGDCQAMEPCPDSPRSEQYIYKGPLTAFQRLMREDMEARDEPNSRRLARHRPATIERFESILATCRPGITLSQDDRDRLGMQKHSTCPLDSSKPAHTLTTLPDDFVHYSQPRILTVREYARLQSFPDWFAFLGNYTTGGDRRRRECPRYTQVANAVPPLLAQAVGSMLMDLDTDLAKAEAAPDASQQELALAI